MKEKLKKNKGITLIALVITIIVLLILAGVTLSTLFGNNGILTESKLAVESNKEANAREQVQLAWAACETEYQAAWTKDSSVVKKDYFDADDLNENLGTGTVKSVGYVENGKSTVTYTLDGTEYEFEIANGQVYKIGQAPDVTAPTPQEPELTSGKLTDIIRAKNYGDFIDYNIDLNENRNTRDDWKVFYNDGENVFIIASDVLPENKIPSISTMTKTGNKVYWNNTLENNKGAAGIKTEVAKKFGLNWLFVGNHGSSTEPNIKAVQDLMDTSKWSNFATGVSGAEAIGSPTLEMLINSWNAKYPDELLRFNKGETTNSDGTIYEYTGSREKEADSNLGYYIGGMVDVAEGTPKPTQMVTYFNIYDFDDWDPDNFFCTLHYKVSYLDSLYNTRGNYLLASPDANMRQDKDWVWQNVGHFLYGVSGSSNSFGFFGVCCVLEGDNFYNWSESNCSAGLRPVVCLPSTVNATKTDNVWTIEQ